MRRKRPPRNPWIGRRRTGSAGRVLALSLSLSMAAGCAGRPVPTLPSIERRGVLDGVGYTRIKDGDVGRARKQAVRAALRDMALSARAVVRTRSAYRIRAEDGRPISESLKDLVEVRAFQVLASRHAREDVDLKAGMYRVYLWLTEEELRDSIEETRIARRERYARARRLYEAAPAETGGNPYEIRKKLTEIRDLIEEADLRSDPDGAAFHARVESRLNRIESRIRQGERLILRAGKALREGRLKTAAGRLESARKKVPGAARLRALKEDLEQRRRRVSDLKREAADLQAEEKHSEALEVFREAGKIDREDEGIQDGVSELRAVIAWKEKERNAKIVSGVKNFFLILGAAALIGVAAASGASVSPYGHTGAWRR